MEAQQNKDAGSGPSKRKKYIQTFKREWKNNLPGSASAEWLEESSKGGNYAYCKCCDKHINITSGKDALKKHQLSQVHLTTQKSLKSQLKISSFNINKEKQTINEQVQLGV